MLSTFHMYLLLVYLSKGIKSVMLLVNLEVDFGNFLGFSVIFVCLGYLMLQNISLFWLVVFFSNFLGFPVSYLRFVITRRKWLFVERRANLMGGGANFGKKGKDKYDIDFGLRIILVFFFFLSFYHLLAMKKDPPNMIKTFGRMLFL